MILVSLSTLHERVLKGPTMQAALSDRLTKILEAVVAAYIMNGRPVGSDYVADSPDFGLSAASIRNLMARLERLGYLAKPHTSAGRIPTERGYRLYVSTVIKSPRLGRSEARAIRSAMDPALSVEVILERVSRRLEELSHQLSVTVSPRRWGPYDYSVNVFGAGNVVAELGTTEEARSLLRVLENRQEIAKILMLDRQEAGTTVTIGSENRCRPMRRCSVVRSQYRMGDARGAIGVIGPMHMEYPRLMALVDYTSQQLTRYLARSGGRHRRAEQRREEERQKRRRA
jgi:transcriptional regulator of heat shock response